MTSDLSESELRLWDRQLQLQTREILLLVDDYVAHPKLVNLQNIKLVFLPANTLSVLQPLDQGVTRSLKCHFSKLLLLRMNECIKKKQEHTGTLLHAIWCVHKSLGLVTEKTIQNCFHHAGITTGYKKSLKPPLLLLLLLMTMACEWVYNVHHAIWMHR
jgi:hypothetical protein